MSSSKAMLPAEETRLAILKARIKAMPKTNRWYPVLQRYIDQITGADIVTVSALIGKVIKGT